MYGLTRFNEDMKRERIGEYYDLDNARKQAYKECKNNPDTFFIRIDFRGKGVKVHTGNVRYDYGDGIVLYITPSRNVYRLKKDGTRGKQLN